MHLGIGQLTQIVAQARGLALLASQALGLVCGLERDRPQIDEEQAEHHGADAVQQNDHGIVALGVLPEAVDEYLALLLVAQAGELGQARDAVGEQKYEECDFKDQQCHALDVLLANDVAQSEYDCG